MACEEHIHVSDVDCNECNMELVVCVCGHYHDGDVCDDCPCRIYCEQEGKQ